jgi:hypothetical protein
MDAFINTRAQDISYYYGAASLDVARMVALFKVGYGY